MEANEASGYHDFTIATVFERLVASIESCVVTWAKASDASGQQRLQAQLQHRLPWRTEPYTLALHLPPPAPPPPPLALPDSEQPKQQAYAAISAWPLVDGAALRDTPHRLQQWFGVRAFLLLTPDSFSGRVLEEEEAHTLLSAAAVALSHARITWPLLLPVHDAVRDGYRGVAVAAGAAGGATIFFDTDSLHRSRVAPDFLLPEQQLLLFARQLGAAGASAAAAACRSAAAAGLDEAPASMAADAVAATGVSGASGSRRVSLALRHSYALPEPGEDRDGGGWAQGEERGGGEWDEQAPWRPWAAQADPVGCLELDVAWRFPDAASAVHAHNAAGTRGHGGSGSAAAAGADSSAGLSPRQAESWRLLALDPCYERDTGHRGFVLRPVDKPRRFLRLRPLVGPAGDAERILAGAADPAPGQLPADSSFYGMLLKLLASCKWAARAPDLGSLASADWWQEQGGPQPPLEPDWVLQEATRDVLQMTVLPVWPAFPPGAVAWPTGEQGQQGWLGKAAPLGALISRFALHALALGSPRSVAELWSRLISTLRLQYWDPLQPLPRMRLGEQGQVEQQRAQQRAQPAAELQSSAVQVSGQVAGQERGGDAHVGSSRPEAPNLDCCLLHQKLQLLDLCIHLLREQQQQQGVEQQRGGQAPAGPNRPQGATHRAATTAHVPAEDGWAWKSGGGANGGPQQGPQLKEEEGAHSPASSSSSYFSVGQGSDASASPASSQHRAEVRMAAEMPGAEGSAEADSAAGQGSGPSIEPAECGGAGVVANGLAEPFREAEPAGADPQPEGAVDVLPGACLHLHPDRPLRVPAVQEPPPQTEDLLAEQHAALQARPASPGQDVAALRGQLQGRMLLSDMQAFKAANPGCCLLDFVRWHSPKDCEQAAGGSSKLSKRMAADGNAWQQLWAAAAPVPAARQRPLLDPQLEGERVLHFLETLPPPALFAELLALGYSAAAQALSSAGAAAEVPAVRQQLSCLAATAGIELAQGVAATVPTGDGRGSSGVAAAGTVQEAGDARGQHGTGTESGEAAADEWDQEWVEDEAAADQTHAQGPSAWPQQQPHWLQSVYGSGLPASRFRRLLLLLGCAEQAVVAAHSLLLRLGWQPGQPLAVASRQSGRGNGSGDGSSSSDFAVSAVAGLVATALGDQPAGTAELCDDAGGAATAPAAVVDVPPDHWPAAEALVLQRWADEDASTAASSSESGPGEWPAPFQRDWLLQVHAGAQGSEEHAAGGTAAANDSTTPPSGVTRVAGTQEAAEGAPPSAAAPEDVPCVPGRPVVQRMYVRALPSEVRIATALCSEPCGGWGYEICS